MNIWAALCKYFQVLTSRCGGLFERAILGGGGGGGQSLNFDKEYLFDFETLVFATPGILSIHNQLVTLQRERET